MEYHRKALCNMCRLCAGRITIRNKKEQGKPCQDQQPKIWNYYEIDVSITAEYIPTQICSKCYRRMLNFKKGLDPAKYSDIKDKAKLVQNAWKEHTDGYCIPCQIYTEQSKGPHQQKLIDQILYAGIPQSSSTPQATCSQSEGMYSPPCSTQSSTHSVNPNTSCQSLDSPPCTPSTSDTSILATSLPSSKSTPHVTHSTSRICQDMAVQTTPRGPFLQDCLKRNKDSPLSKGEAKVTVHNVKRALQYSEDKKTAALPTGGKVRLHLYISNVLQEIIF